MEIVVGAGFAGLNAAATLVEAGREVRVIEARDRVGGRVFSRTLPNGAVIEMGAEFILPGNTYIRERADQLGLGLWDKGVRYGRREARGGPPVVDEELSEALALLEETLTARPEAARRSAAALLAELEIAAGAREYILSRTEISSASSAETVPAGEPARRRPRRRPALPVDRGRQPGRWPVPSRGGSATSASCSSRRSGESRRGGRRPGRDRLRRDQRRRRRRCGPRLGALGDRVRPEPRGAAGGGLRRGPLRRGGEAVRAARLRRRRRGR